MPFDFAIILKRQILPETLNFEEDLTFLMPVAILSFLWLLCLCAASVPSNVEAFRGMLNRRFEPPLNKLKNIIRADSSSSYEFMNDLIPAFSVDGIPGMEELAPHAPDVTHFCFLIHGHRGLSKDLRYMQAVMQKLANLEKLRQYEELSNATHSGDFDGEDSSSSSTESFKSADQRLVHDMVVHNVVCNEHKTTDGVQKGGDRLVNEMLDVIESEMKKRHPVTANNEIYDVTISVLGNSLGGLFGRYAIAKLVERHCTKESDGPDACWILNGTYRIHLNVFCTTATPHLGVSQHTYIRIPRTAEIGVAHAMGETGKDLFRLNDLLHKMATCPTFLGPLGSFRKRVAYANAYHTDFPVPACTAAFLSENSTYPHHFTEELMMEDDNRFVIATLHTPTEKQNAVRNKHGRSSDVHNSSDPCDVDSTDQKAVGESSAPVATGDLDKDLHRMSMSLDRLGWKKVFIDIREEIPSVELPKSFRMRRQHSSSRLIVDSWRSKKIVQSKDVATAISLPTDNRLCFPLGHNMIVAFSRSRISTFMNRGGRPVVDALARELVEDIFNWSGMNASMNSSTKQS